MRVLPWFVGCALAVGCSKPPAEAETPPAAVDAGSGQKPKPTEVTLLITGAENGYLLPTADETGQVQGGAAEVLGRWVATDGHCAGALGPNGEAACPEARTVVLSTGDNANGAAISSVFHGEPTAELMKHMGYAASAFGNHEVDFGRPQFARNKEASGMPFLAANVSLAADSQSAAPVVVQPFRVVSRGGVKLAIVGLTSQKTPTTSMPGRLDGVVVGPDEQALQAVMPQLAKERPNATVVLTDGCLSELATLLDQHADWHVTVGAGRSCETPAPAKAGGAVLVNPGSHWRQYARVKLTFDGPTLTDQVADVVPVTVGADAPKPEPQAAALVAGWKKKLDDAFGQQIGYTATGFDQTAAATGTWLAKALKEHTKADVGLFNRHSIRASLPKGAITLASVYDLTPFENRVVVAKVPGELLKKELANPEAVFFGVTLAGLNPKKTYSVATHNFVFFGGDGFGLQKSSTSSTFTGEAWQTAVIEWTKKQGSSAKKPLEATWGR